MVLYEEKNIRTKMQYNETISCLSAKRSYNFIKIKIKFYKRFNIFFWLILLLFEKRKRSDFIFNF